MQSAEHECGYEHGFEYGFEYGYRYQYECDGDFDLKSKGFTYEVNVWSIWCGTVFFPFFFLLLFFIGVSSLISIFY